MIQNANIPLSTQQPTRQKFWRVGLFLTLTITGVLIGWTLTKRINSGVTVPQLETPSGMSIRLTSENALWLTMHTQGLALSASCPIDIPTLLAHQYPSWLLLGDTGKEIRIAMKGNVPETLKNYQKAFACDIVTFADKKTLHFTNPDAWIWKGTTNTGVSLSPQGVQIRLATKGNAKEKIWIPKQILTQALPLQNTNTGDLPHIWQGLHDIFLTETEGFFFSWNAKGNEDAFALLIKEDLTDEEMHALFYDLANIPTEIQKIFREDGISYLATKQEDIVVKWKNEREGEVQRKDGTAVGYIRKEAYTILLSTAFTEWEEANPYWKITEQQTEKSPTHRAKTLANFGEELFATPKKLTIKRRGM